MSPGTAVPAWLLQILPKWFLDRPAFTEAAYAALVSMTYSTVPIVGAIYGVAVSQGHGGSLGDFANFIGANWFGLIMGYLFGTGIAGVRGKQAAAKATASESSQKGSP